MRCASVGLFNVLAKNSQRFDRRAELHQVTRDGFAQPIRSRMEVLPVTREPIALRRDQNSFNLLSYLRTPIRQRSALATFPFVRKSDLQKLIIAHDDGGQTNTKGRDDIALCVANAATLKRRVGCMRDKSFRREPAKIVPGRRDG